MTKNWLSRAVGCGLLFVGFAPAACELLRSLRGTRAQTLPPNPAPNADAAYAPSARACFASHTVSGTWLPRSFSAAACDSSTSLPKVPRSRAASASQACGMMTSDSSLNCSKRLSSHSDSTSPPAWRSAARRRSSESGGAVATAASVESVAPEIERQISRIVSSGLRRAIVLRAGGASLAGHHAADGDDEGAVLRQLDGALQSHRAEGVLLEVSGQRGEDGSMVFAAAKRSHSTVACQRLVRLTVFDAAQVTREVLNAVNVGGVFLAFREPIDRAKHRKHRDHQGAGAAHPGGRWQIAGQRDVCAALVPGDW